MRLAVPLLAALALPLPVLSTTIRVPADQPSIQQGIDAATFGDTVLCAPGIHLALSEIRFGGRPLLLTSEQGAQATIIQGTNGRVLNINQQEGQGTIVRGFTIKGGGTNFYGGGILCDGTSPTVIACVITECSASSGGGIGAINGGSPTFLNCEISHCHTSNGSGGGLFCQGSAPQFTTCTFSENTTSRHGGGVHCLSPGASFIECTFSRNWTLNGGKGAGVYLDACSPTIIGCTFYANTCYGGPGAGLYGSSPTLITIRDCLFKENAAIQGHGGGAFVESSPSWFVGCSFFGNAAVGGVGAGMALSSSSCTLDHCTFWGNTSLLGAGIGLMLNATAAAANTIIALSTKGTAVFCGDISTATFTCGDIWGNHGGDWVGCIASQIGVNGNMHEDPQFCDPDGGEFTISSESPCAPEHSPAGCGLIGALPVACGVTDVADSPLAVDLRLTVTPNPVRGIARFEAGHAAPFSQLSIFDSQGRVVEQLTGENGHWEWTPGSAVPAGVYFAIPESAVDLEPVKFLHLR